MALETGLDSGDGGAAIGVAEVTRVLPSGDEAGSPPGDRAFRPDVEGLRGVAVLLVVLYHAGLSWLPGGYVGVDVFFVISGYVITGLLLRERTSTGTTSLLGFYARRVRRILPAATLVLITTVIAAHFVLGTALAVQTAVDAKWAAVFLANFHFTNVGTNYLAAQSPPSPLQNFWTLAVEEQFYLVFPTLILLVASLRSRFSLRTKLLATLGVLGVLSLWWSVVQTNTDPNAAYFSPFTRAWELALGAIVALAAPALVRIPRVVAAILTWVGLTGVIVAGLVYTVSTPYPGIAVALPVIGTAMLIAGGTAHPRYGSERLLSTLPFRQLGRISYSLYLWHWPILILAAESQGRSSLPLSSNLWWILVALLASIATLWLVENPIRHSRWLRWRLIASIGMGAVLVGATLLVSSVEAAQVARINWAFWQTPSTTVSTASINTVERLVAVAPTITSVPTDLDPPLQTAQVGYPLTPGCDPLDYSATEMKPCLFGDPNGEKGMVLYGDSHSAMWFLTIDDIAMAEHWKLWYLGKAACPVELLPMVNPGAFGSAGGEYTQCAQWHTYAIAQINRLKPNLVIATQEFHDAPGYRTYTSVQWRDGLERFFSSIKVPGVKFDVIGNIPQLSFDPYQCLDTHSLDVQACSAPRAKSLVPYGQAEREAVASVGGHYADVTPWFCSHICTAVIGKYQVYFDQGHLMAPYAIYLGGLMAHALQIPVSADAPVPITIKLSAPHNGAVLKGRVVLDALTRGVHNLTKVQVVLTGQGGSDAVVATLRTSLFGWVARWNSASVPNGKYNMIVQVETSPGGSRSSTPIDVVVQN